MSAKLLVFFLLKFHIGFSHQSCLHKLAGENGKIHYPISKPSDKIANLALRGEDLSKTCIFMRNLERKKLTVVFKNVILSGEGIKIKVIKHSSKAKWKLLKQIRGNTKQSTVNIKGYRYVKITVPKNAASFEMKYTLSTEPVVLCPKLNNSVRIIKSTKGTKAGSKCVLRCANGYGPNKYIKKNSKMKFTATCRKQTSRKAVWRPTLERSICGRGKKTKKECKKKFQLCVPVTPQKDMHDDPEKTAGPPSSDRMTKTSISTQTSPAQRSHRDTDAAMHDDYVQTISTSISGMPTAPTSNLPSTTHQNSTRTLKQPQEITRNETSTFSGPVPFVSHEAPTTTIPTSTTRRQHAANTSSRREQNDENVPSSNNVTSSTSTVKSVSVPTSSAPDRDPKSILPTNTESEIEASAHKATELRDREPRVYTTDVNRPLAPSNGLEIDNVPMTTDRTSVQTDAPSTDQQSVARLMTFSSQREDTTSVSSLITGSRDSATTTETPPPPHILFKLYQHLKPTQKHERNNSRMGPTFSTRQTTIYDETSNETTTAPGLRSESNLQENTNRTVYQPIGTNDHVRENSMVASKPYSTKHIQRIEPDPQQATNVPSTPSSYAISRNVDDSQATTGSPSETTKGHLVAVSKRYPTKPTPQHSKNEQQENPTTPPTVATAEPTHAGASLRPYPTKAKPKPTQTSADAPVSPTTQSTATQRSTISASRSNPTLSSTSRSVVRITAAPERKVIKLKQICRVFCQRSGITGGYVRSCHAYGTATLTRVCSICRYSPAQLCFTGRIV